MKAVTIILLLFVVILAGACSKIAPDNQEITNGDQESINDNQEITNDRVTIDATLDDQNMESELVSDPLDESMGVLDELPIDDSIPE